MPTRDLGRAVETELQGTSMTLGWIRNTANLAASTLSKCHALQTWQGATYTQAQALGRIYHHALPPPANKREHTLAELDRKSVV